MTVQQAWKRLAPLPTTKDLLRIYGIKAKKALSQNFIIDPKILQKFVRIAGNIQDAYAIEVGPGPGGITRAILDAQVKECHVIEKDPRFVPTLNMIKNAVGAERLHVSIGDCLHYNVSRKFEGKVIPVEWDSPMTPNLVLFGNLPFNVATPFLIKLLRNMSDQSNIYSFGRVPAVLSFQHEVAARMIAAPEQDTRCRLSVIVQNWAEVEYVHTLKGGAFVPPPDVDVGIVKLVPHRQPYIQLPYPLVDSVISALFVSGKNKFIVSNLKRLFSSQGISSPPDCLNLSNELLKRCDIEPQKSAVNLTMQEIKSICFTYQLMKETHPALSGLKDNQFEEESEAELFEVKTDISNKIAVSD